MAAVTDKDAAFQAFDPVDNLHHFLAQVEGIANQRSGQPVIGQLCPEGRLMTVQQLRAAIAQVSAEPGTRLRHGVDQGGVCLGMANRYHYPGLNESSGEINGTWHFRPKSHQTNIAASRVLKFLELAPGRRPHP
jgi:hypothetical protein